MIQSQTIKILKSISLYSIVVVSVVSNFVNYFYSYLYLKDSRLQWRLAMISISVVLLLSAFYIWLTESLKEKNYIKTTITGWLCIYLLFNFIGVMLGYTLHTKAFMMILFTVVFFGVIHLFIKLWEKYY